MGMVIRFEIEVLFRLFLNLVLVYVDLYIVFKIFKGYLCIIKFLSFKVYV